jgi:hypothetical protein
MSDICANRSGLESSCVEKIVVAVVDDDLVAKIGKQHIRVIAEVYDVGNLDAFRSEHFLERGK